MFHRAALASAFVFSAAVAAAAPPVNRPLEGPAVCFYGPPPLEKLAAFRTVVVQSALVSAADVAFLQRQGCRVLGYVSLGEDDHLRRGNGKGPGGYASWYVDEHVGTGTAKPGADNQPDSNPDWGSYYVDPSDHGWRALVRDEVRHMRDDLGMDGVFADTVVVPRDVFTTPREHRMVHGMTSLIGSLKSWARGGSVLVNNGGDGAATLGRKVDGVMIETQIDGPSANWTGLRLEAARLAPFRQQGMLVTALIYIPQQMTAREACAALAEMSLPAALYREDDAGRALTTLPFATCP